MKPKLKTTLVEFMLVVPALALFILFVVYPLIGGIYYSFTSWNGIDINIKFVGFKNYLSIFKDKYVLEPMANTFIFAFFSMILLNVLGLVFAVGLERLTRGKNLMRALLFVPAVLSSLVVGYIFKFIFGEPVAALGKYWAAVSWLIIFWEARTMCWLWVFWWRHGRWPAGIWLYISQVFRILISPCMKPQILTGLQAGRNSVMSHSR